MNERSPIIFGEVGDIRNYSRFVHPNDLRREFPHLSDFTPIGLQFAENCNSLPLFLRYTYGTNLLADANGTPSSTNNLFIRTMLEDLNSMPYTELFLVGDMASNFIQSASGKRSAYRIMSHSNNLNDLERNLDQSIDKGRLPVIFLDISGGMSRLVGGRKPFETDTVQQACAILDKYYHQIALLGSTGSDTHERMFPLLKYFNQIYITKDHDDPHRSKQGVAYLHEGMWFQCVADPQIVKRDYELANSVW